MVQKSRLRVGAVSYLNTKPLIYPLTNGDISTNEIALTEQVPSQLAKQLRDGNLDIGLIPIIEYFRSNLQGADYSIIPNIAIASNGKVLSIQLFSCVPIKEIKKIALDTSSRSSVAMLKILLAEKYQLSPTFASCDPSIDPGKSEEDAVLLIGDAALKNLNTTEYSVDLGEEWHELTGQPFVYACWVARSGVMLGDVPKILLEAKKNGIKHIPEIARIESQKLGLPENLCIDYLSNHIQYDLGESEISGLKHFYELAVKNRLIDSGCTLNFVN